MRFIGFGRVERSLHLGFVPETGRLVGVIVENLIVENHVQQGLMYTNAVVMSEIAG